MIYVASELLKTPAESFCPILAGPFKASGGGLVLAGKRGGLLNWAAIILF
jgi:hypothetical protein